MLSVSDQDVPVCMFRMQRDVSENALLVQLEGV